MLFLTFFLSATAKYFLTAFIFERCMGFAFLLIHLGIYYQLDGLLCSNGIAPAIRVCEKVNYKRRLSMLENLRRFPSLFLFFAYSDRRLRATSLIGIISSLLIIIGIAPWFSALVTFIVWSSLCAVAGDFMSSSQHALVLELNMLYLITRPFLSYNPLAMIAVLRILLFRLMMGSAAGKQTASDGAWRLGTAYRHLLETQPLPNAIASIVHRRAPSFLLGVWAVRLTLFIEGVLSLSAVTPFVGQPTRSIVFFIYNAYLLLTQVVLGNHGFQWLLTSVTSLSMLDDGVWRQLMSNAWPNDVPHRPSFLSPRLIRLNWIGLVPSPATSYYVWLLWCFAWLGVVVYALLQLVPLAATFRNRLPLPEPIRSIVLWPWVMCLRSELFRLHVAAPCREIWLLITDVYYFIRPFSICSRYVHQATVPRSRLELVIEIFIPKRQGEQQKVIAATMDDDEEAEEGEDSSSRGSLVRRRRGSALVAAAANNDDNNDTNNDSIGGKWREIDFAWKPSRINRPPPFIPLSYLPTLDYQLCLLPTRPNVEAPAWFLELLRAILQQRSEVLRLLAPSAAVDDATPSPTAIRAVIYNYAFGERNWWHRQSFKGVYYALSINDEHNDNDESSSD